MQILETLKLRSQMNTRVHENDHLGNTLYNTVYALPLEAYIGHVKLKLSNEQTLKCRIT